MNNTKKMTMAAFFMALGLVMPFFTGQIPEIGSMLLPMHIPVLLCGFFCGWEYGLTVGFIVPIFRSVLFGRPFMMPTAVAMAFELAAYGAVAGYLYQKLKAKKGGIFISLLGAMIAGRALWGVVSIALFKMVGSVFTWEVFVAGAFMEAIPGIIVQLLLIPTIVSRLKVAGR